MQILASRCQSRMGRIGNLIAAVRPGGGFVFSHVEKPGWTWVGSCDKTAWMQNLPPLPKRRRFGATLLLLLCSLLPAAADHRPNVVFFLIDDFGWMDIGANNPNCWYDTPHIDQLARTGVRFTNGYAANPVCSPTRFSIMTGKYPTRHDATDWFTGQREGRFRPAEMNSFMPLEEITMAETLKEAGYSTCFAGKWHLGDNEKFWPEHQGFDYNFGGHDRGSPPGGYFSPYNNPRLSDGPEGEHLPRRLVDESIRFIEKHREGPFFLYLSFYSVHTPLQARRDLIEKYEKRLAVLPALLKTDAFADEEQVWPTDRPRQVRISQTHAVYAAMVEAMDEQIGRVLLTLEELGVSDKTAVFFMSDNGGLSTAEGSPTSNLPLRGGKGWLYEGGIREPFLIRWPRGQSAPGVVCDHPVISTDFYPTILEICGLPPRPQQHLDGISLVPLLRNPVTQLSRDTLYWHYPHYSNQGGFPGAAIRVGNWKLIERFENGNVSLYDLAADLEERHDLANREPARVNAMRHQLHQWFRSVNAKFLRPKAGNLPWRP